MLTSDNSDSFKITNIDDDIKDTLLLFKYLKNEM